MFVVANQQHNSEMKFLAGSSALAAFVRNAKTKRLLKIMNNMKITVNYPEKFAKKPLYPYWAVNSSGGVFLVTSPNKGLWIGGWTEIATVVEYSLIPLPKGCEIKIEV